MEDLNPKENLVEVTLDTDIANTDENLSVDQMFQQSSLPSLGKQILSVQQIHGPTAGLFNLKKVTKSILVPEVPAEAQITTGTPVAANATVYTLTINSIDYSYTSDASGTIAEIVTGLTLEINVTETNGSVPVTATDNTTDIILTADIDGNEFTVADTGAGTINLVATNPNQPFVASVNDDSLTVVRADVAVYEPVVPIKTDMTSESVQDIRATYGKEADNLIGKMLRGLANDVENTKTLHFLETESLDYGPLTLTDSLNAETNLFEISQRVQEIVLKMNNKNIRTFEAFAVLPFTVLGGVMALSKYAGADDMSERGLFITKIGQTSYYLSSDPEATVAYVGLKDSDDPSRSSGVFSPYVSEIIESANPDSGQPTYNIYNRFAITASPLHETDNEMFYKFEIA